MATVVLSTHNVVNYPEGGGHFWVYLQYVEGLRRAGCDVYWLEQFVPWNDPPVDAELIRTFLARMDSRGMADKVVLYSLPSGNEVVEPTYLNLERQEAEAVMKRADLMLNFNYRMRADLVGRFRRTALVDIDPGLLQIWIAAEQVCPAPHDHYFTTGETVGTERALFPSGGLDWVRFRPPVVLELWPYVHTPESVSFTTVAGWWSGEGVAEIVDGRRVVYDNTKRIAFLAFVDLPQRTPQPLELALCLSKNDGPEQRRLESHGWRVRHARDVSATPEMYQAYIQQSRGEFSCAKPSCMKLQNAWVSDRTLCYLASGKPAVVQDTGPSTVLPHGHGLFRFSTPDEAANALRAVNADYVRQCRAARELAEAHFDARLILPQLLDVALS